MPAGAETTQLELSALRSGLKAVTAGCGAFALDGDYGGSNRVGDWPQDFSDRS